MAKVAILGSTGYIGESLCDLIDNHKVIPVSRNSISELTNSEEVSDFFADNSFDVVINCAGVGGHRNVVDEWDVADTNLQIHYNLMNALHAKTKYISIGSGAEIYHNNRPYGLSKFIISKSIEQSLCPHYNLRVFGIFDHNELPTRFIKKNIIRYIARESMEVYEDKKMDFFYMDDFVKLVKHYIENPNPPKQIDCVYNGNHSLMSIANVINQCDKHKVAVNLGGKFAYDYVGSFTDLGLKYKGLEKGIEETYNKLK
jgi:nucleoside-diphosphate-sugar epimerase